MRKIRNTQNVNNTAAKSSKSSTATATHKSATETYGITIASAFRAIMDAIEASKGKESQLTITKTPKRGIVLISCKGVFAPAVTNAIRKEANVIAGDECWNETDHCYRAWNKGKQRYEISRDAWDAAEAAAKTETEKPSRKQPKRDAAPAKEPAKKTEAAASFTLEQVMDIARKIRKGVKDETIKTAITEVTGFMFAKEESAEQKKRRELQERIAALEAELADLATEKRTKATRTTGKNGKRKAAKGGKAAK